MPRLPAVAETPLIAVAGASEYEQQAREAGFDAYLVKPVLPDVLLAEVAKWVLALRAARAEARALRAQNASLRAQVAALGEESSQLRERAKALLAASMSGKQADGSLCACSLCGASCPGDPEQAWRAGWRPVLLGTERGLRNRVYCPAHTVEAMEADVARLLDRPPTGPRPDRRARRA